MKLQREGPSPAQEGLMIFAACLLYALSLNLFLAGNQIAAGGLVGIAVIINHICGVRISLLLLLMNLPLVAAALAIKGWRFTRNTVLGFVLYTALVEVTSYLPTLTIDPVVAAVFGGVGYGLGLALMGLGNGSIGGTELIIRILVSYFPNIGVGKLCLAVDGGVVVLSMAVFGGVEIGLYAILTLFICSLVADQAGHYLEQKELCLVITERSEDELAELLMSQLCLSVTKVEGVGMYRKTGRSVLLIAADQAGTARLKTLLAQRVPDCFVVVLPVNEATGGSFRRLYIP